MNTIEEIKRRIQRVIDIEKGITRREREEFVEKREAQSTYFGVGGFYRRHDRLVDDRDKHLEELDQLSHQTGSAIKTEKLTMYAWYCPDCNIRIMLNAPSCRHAFGKDAIDCPICQRTLFRDGARTSWTIASGSEYTEPER